ncbi:MAG: proprotein convertase P-domain-containing protein [Planctomycetota bacterium]
MQRFLPFLTGGLVLLWVSIAVAQTPTVETCASPGTAFGGEEGGPSQIASTVTVAETIAIADVHVAVDITHAFVGDLEVSITHEGTTVGLHAGAGGSARDLDVIFRDSGVPNGAEGYDCGCSVQPSGPGTLSDFTATPSTGSWTLDIVDTFPSLDDGRLNEWCVRIFDTVPPPPPPPVANLLCFSPPGSGFAQVAWSLFQVYSEIQIWMDGSLAAVLPGNLIGYQTPPLSIPSTVEIAVVGVTAGGSSPPRGCIAYVEDQVDLERCATPGTLVSEIFPVINVIHVAEPRPIGDIQVQVDITHTFVGDLLVDVTSPANTTVRVHDGSGLNQQDLKVTYWEFGTPNGDLPYNCECNMQPTGPGSMVDFSGELTLGDWRLSVVDRFAGDFGSLNEWCLRTYDNMPVFAVSDLACGLSATAGSVDVSWTHPTDHDAVDVFVDGVLEAVLVGPFLAGSSNTYTTIPLTGPDLLQICVVPRTGAVSGPQQCCSISVTVPPVQNLGWTTVGASGVIDLDWTLPRAYDSIQIYLNDVQIASIAGNATSFSTPPQAVPSSGRLCVEGFLSAFGFSARTCAPFLLLPTVDLEECSSPTSVITDLSTPTQDTITVGSSDLIMDLEVALSLSHTFVGDLDVDLSSPLGTVVRLHDQGGGSANDLNLLFADNGVLNGTAPYDCGCTMQPSGVNGAGSLMDFAQEPAAGPWTLSVTDNFALDDGLLQRWCLRVPVACSLLPPGGLACSVTGVDVTLSWSNSAAYDEIQVVRDGVTIATLPGSATTYLDAGAPAGTRTYRLLVGQIGLACQSLSLPCQLSFGITDIVFRGESPSEIDSAAALAAALTNNGRVVLVVGELNEVSVAPPASDIEALWLVLGTFPDNHRLTVDEGDLLVRLHTGDRDGNGTQETDRLPIYLEGPDVWGFDPPTAFIDYDGVQDGPIDDGDDSLEFVVGQNTGLGLDLSGGVWDAFYSQDQFGPDYNDHLLAAGSPPDLGGPNVAVLWQGDPVAAPYAVGLYYDSTVAPVLALSYEFGGYAGDQTLLAQVYSNALAGAFSPPPGGDDFVRGDFNQDQTIIINDPILILSYLFVPGSAAPACFDAADSNDDGQVGIADVIFLLGYLFQAQGSVSPPPPGAENCGPDPTPDELPSCSFSACAATGSGGAVSAPASTTTTHKRTHGRKGN